MEDDYESKLDEVELSNLQKAISEVETALAVSTPGTRSFFENFLLNAKGRIGTLEKKIKEAERKQEEHARSEIALVNLARKETELNDTEKEAYSGFLKETFFTKKDFIRLEEFYSKTWDRLSPDGKDQMSERIWEGIRQDEYIFSELPKSVREKETDQAYRWLKDSSINSGSASRVPEQDRNNFIRAYENGTRDEAGRILDHQGFKENMFRDTNSKEIRHSSVTSGKEAMKVTIAENVRNNAGKQEKEPASPPIGSLGDLDLTSIDLADMKSADSSTQGSLTGLPRKTSVAARES